MNTSKQKRQRVILAVLGLGLLASLLYAVRTSFSELPPGPTVQSAGAVSAQQGLVIERTHTKGKKSLSLLSVDPKIHLEKLSGFDPGKPLNVRNMFAFETAPPVSVARPNTGEGRRLGDGTEGAKGGMPPPAGGTVGPPPPPPVVINLKFYGVKVNLETKKREGFFIDGVTTYLAAEGDLVGNRYRILKVAEAFAEVEDVSSKARRQLPMVTQ